MVLLLKSMARSIRLKLLSNKMTHPPTPKQLPALTCWEEVAGLVHQTNTNKYLRPGQALSNTYTLPKYLEDDIYNDTSVDVVITKVFNYFCG
jgi:hypothetical protein